MNDNCVMLHGLADIAHEYIRLLMFKARRSAILAETGCDGPMWEGNSLENDCLLRKFYGIMLVPF